MEHLDDLDELIGLGLSPRPEYEQMIPAPFQGTNPAQAPAEANTLKLAVSVGHGDVVLIKRNINDFTGLPWRQNPDRPFPGYRLTPGNAVRLAGLLLEAASLLR